MTNVISALSQSRASFLRLERHQGMGWGNEDLHSCTRQVKRPAEQKDLAGTVRTTLTGGSRDG